MTRCARSLALGVSFVLQVFGGAAEQGVGALCDSQARAAHLVVQAAQGVRTAGWNSADAAVDELDDDSRVSA